jgi:hypothetical protein
MLKKSSHLLRLFFSSISSDNVRILHCIPDVRGQKAPTRSRLAGIAQKRPRGLTCATLTAPVYVGAVSGEILTPGDCSRQLTSPETSNIWSIFLEQGPDSPAARPEAFEFQQNR